MKLTITKEFQWDCAHRLNDINLSEEENLKIFGKCNTMHGHTYKLFTSVSKLYSIIEEESNYLQNGMVINFVDLKSIVNSLVVNRFDHTTLNNDILYENDRRLTTCENQVYDIWQILDKPLRNKNIQLEEIKLYETPTSFATLTR